MRSSPGRPFVAARRWDQLGTRLSAIINARACAELFELEFRFAWPRGGERSVRDPGELFTDEFLAEFELSSDELDGVPSVGYHELLALEHNRREAVLDGSSGEFVEMDELFGVVRAEAEDNGTARHRYRRCFEELGWNDVTRGLIELVARSSALEGLAGVHVRAGDIVSGPWRHAIAHQKYEPTPFVHQTLTAFVAQGRKILLLSDSPEYVDYLRSWFATIVTAPELIPGYESLADPQQALADILLLSRCDPIAGPPASTFSKLAANLGRAVVARSDALVPAGEEVDLLRAGIAGGTRLAADSQLWRELTAHDICWLLDVFGDTLTLGDQLDLAGEAVRLDPEFCGARCRLGRIAALAGKRRQALNATSGAITIAERVDRHDDPLFEALASDIVARGLTGLARPAELEMANYEYDRLSRLEPFWFEKTEVLHRLAFLLGVSQTVSSHPHRRRRLIARTVRDDLKLPPETVGWQTDGLAQHRSRVLFDPLRRDLDRITRQVSRSLQILGVATTQICYDDTQIFSDIKE